MEKAVWDAYYTRVFCDICMEEVNANNRDGSCLSRKGYKNLGDKFAEKTEKRLTKKQFKNKCDALKKEYTGWMELQNATGLGWDPETKTMDADDDWWKTHLAVSYMVLSCLFFWSLLCLFCTNFSVVFLLQYRPDHAKFRAGPPANLTQLDVMFRKAHVTGESSAIPGEETGEDKEGAILLDDDGDASKKTALGKRKMGAGEKEKESPFFKVYNNAMNSLVSRVAEVGSSCDKEDLVPNMKQFLAMVRECGVKEGTILMFTACKLAVKREHRELFAALESTEGRFHYLEMMHDEMNK